MALLRKRVPTFGREDRVSGLRTLLRGQTFVVRLVAFLIAAGLFLLIVTITHKHSRTIPNGKDSVTIEHPNP